MGVEHKLAHHRIDVHRAGDRIGFEIPLPLDAESVCGLAAGARPGRLGMVRAGSLTGTAGILTLRWDMPGDVFLQLHVPHGGEHEDNYRHMGLTAPDAFANGLSGLGITGGKVGWAEIEVPGNLRTLKGYYVDTVNRLAGLDENYRVDLFLLYVAEVPR